MQIFVQRLDVPEKVRHVTHTIWLEMQSNSATDCISLIDLGLFCQDCRLLFFW